MKENKSTLLEKIKSKASTGARETSFLLTSVFFWKNIAILVATIAVLLVSTWLWLSFYTDHGESVEVGDYIGLKVEEAIKQAEDRNIKITVTDSVFIYGKKGGTIQDQNPRPSARVKENRTISLITYKYSESAKLPRLTGNYDFERYKRSLSAKDFDLEISEKVFDPKQAANTILYLLHEGKKLSEDDIEKGVELPRGTKLQAVVTKRNSDFIQIPDVICKTYGEAEFLIESARLTVGNVVGNAGDLNSAYIYSQEPASDKSLRVGEAVTVYITEQLPEGCN